MPNLLDSAASGQEYVISSTSAVLTWTHHVSPSALNTQAFVALQFAGFASVSSGTFTATFGGVAMTQIAQSSWSNATVILYQLASPAAGSNTVRVSFSGVASSIQPGGFLGVSETVSNVALVGTPVIATPSSSANSTVTGSSVAAAYRVLFVHGVGIGTGLSSYNQTGRASAGLFNGGGLLIGDAPGAATVTSTAHLTGTTASWAAIAVPLTPTPVYAGFSGQQFGILQPIFRGGIYRVSTPPEWRDWEASPIQGDQGPFLAAQDPDAVLDYGIDFSGWLAPSDSLINVNFVTDSTDIRVISQDCTDTMAVVWLDFPSGGTAGETYNITCHATSYLGRQDIKTFQVRCQRGTTFTGQ